VKVQGWTYVDESAADGESVWKPNMLVEVDLPYLGLHEDLLISKCHFDLSENGTTTTLELVHPSAEITGQRQRHTPERKNQRSQWR
jgi:prophage tail gpP-like protein